MKNAPRVERVEFRTGRAPELQLCLRRADGGTGGGGRAFNGDRQRPIPHPRKLPRSKGKQPGARQPVGACWSPAGGRGRKLRNRAPPVAMRRSPPPAGLAAARPLTMRSRRAPRPSAGNPPCAASPWQWAGPVACSSPERSSPHAGDAVPPAQRHPARATPARGAPATARRRPSQRCLSTARAQRPPAFPQRPRRPSVRGWQRAGAAGRGAARPGSPRTV